MLDSNIRETTILPEMPEYTSYSCFITSVTLLEMPEDNCGEMGQPPTDDSHEDDFERKRSFLVEKSKKFPFPVELEDTDAVDDNCHHGNVKPDYSCHQ